MITCGKCGNDNPLGRIFCTQCGEKLNLDQLNEPEMIKRDPRDPKNSTRARAILFILLDIIVLTLVLGGLSFWPAPHEASLGADNLGQAALGKLTRLDSTTVSLTHEFSEKEANVLLARYLSGQQKANALHVRGVHSIELQFEPNAVRATAFASIGPWHFGTFSLGPFPLTYSVLAVPIVEGGIMRFDVRRGAIGHLPLPGPLGKPAADKLGEIFSKASRYQTLFNKASSIELQKGTVKIGIKK